MDNKSLLSSLLFPAEHVFSALARALLLKSLPMKLSDRQRGLLSGTFPLSPFNVFNQRHAQVIGEIAGDYETYALQHTAFGYYSHLFPFEMRKVVKVGDQKAKRGWPFMPHLTHILNTRAWRHCPLCIESDRQEHGTAYWHVLHQFPTSLTCYRHPEQALVSQCSYCGWQNTDLRESAVPDTTCKACGRLMMHHGFDHNALTWWIQKEGEKLHNSASDILKPRFEHQVTRQVEKQFVNVIGNRQSQSWSIAHNLEKEFERWLQVHQLTRYFEEIDSKTLMKLLSLEKTVRTPRKVHLLTHLLWQAFFNGVGRLHAHSLLAS